MRARELDLVEKDPGIPKQDPESMTAYEKICQFTQTERAKMDRLGISGKKY
jgi:hypothetical protein